MHRIAVTLLVAVAWPTHALTADAPRPPTSPQVPAPAAAQEKCGSHRRRGRARDRAAAGPARSEPDRE